MILSGSHSRLLGEPSLCSILSVFIDPYIIQSHLTLPSPCPLFCQRLKKCCCLTFVMMFCPPAASAHSLPPPPTHKPCPLNLLFFDHKAEKNLVPVSISSPVTPQATKENHFHFFYSILHFHHWRQTEPGHALHVALHIICLLYTSDAADE